MNNPLLSDLERELALLLEALEEDADWHGRDYLPNGRWPFVHNLEKRIEEMRRMQR